MANKSIGNRQKRVVAPPRPAPARKAPAGRPRFRPPAARPAATLTLLLHEAHAAAAGPALKSALPGLELLEVRGSELPPGAERTRVYLRAWEGGAAIVLNKLLAAAPDLAWVHTPSVGIDHLPLAEMERRGILLTNGAGVHTIPLAESAMAFLLARAKRAAEHLANQKARRWEDLPLGELSGERLLLFGYGSIGRAIGERAKSFGMSVAAVRRSGKREKGLAEVHPPTELCEAVSRADAVVIAAPLTEATRGAFDARVFAAMKENCHLVNVSRGEIVVEADLVEGLRRGRPAFASLDVFAKEPLPPDSPLWELPNAAITPHDSWRSPHTRARSLELFVENLRRYLGARPLRNRVDYRRGY